MIHRSKASAVINVLLLINILLLSCSESTFSGQNRDSAQNADGKSRDIDGFGGKGSDPSDGVHDGGTIELDASDSDSDSDREFTDADLGGFFEGDKKLAIDEDGRRYQRFAATEKKSDTDVVFIIDTSGSMDNEISQVESRLGAFIDKLLADDRTKNFQLFILAGKDKERFDPPAEVNRNEKFDFSASGHEVGSHNALAVARSFLEGGISTPKLRLRQDAIKHLVFVTDDEGQRDNSDNPNGIDEGEFRQFLQQRHQDVPVHVHGIVCHDKGNGCQRRGSAYINLSQQYDGLIQDLTSPDWTPLLNKLAETIGSGVGNRFELSKEPSDSDDVDVYVDRKKLRKSEFEIDGKFVVLAEDALDADSEIVVVY